MSLKKGPSKKDKNKMPKRTQVPIKFDQLSGVFAIEYTFNQLSYFNNSIFLG